MERELEAYIKKINEKYKLNARLAVGREHIAVFPPHGGMDIDIYTLVYDNQYVELGSNYGSSVESCIQKINEALHITE